VIKTHKTQLKIKIKNKKMFGFSKKDKKNPTEVDINADDQQKNLTNNQKEVTGVIGDNNPNPGSRPPTSTNTPKPQTPQNQTTTQAPNPTARKTDSAQKPAQPNDEKPTLITPKSLNNQTPQTPGGPPKTPKSEQPKEENKPQIKINPPEKNQSDKEAEEKVKKLIESTMVKGEQQKKDAGTSTIDDFASESRPENSKKDLVNLNKNQTPEEDKIITFLKKLKKVISINIGSVVGSISFSKQNYGGTLTMEQLTKYAKKYEEILSEVDKERHARSKILAENYKKLVELIDNSDLDPKESRKRQTEVIPKITHAIDRLVEKNKEYNHLDPEDPLYNATKPKLEESKADLERYLNKIKETL